MGNPETSHMSEEEVQKMMINAMDRDEKTPHTPMETPEEYKQRVDSMTDEEKAAATEHAEKDSWFGDQMKDI